MYAVVNCNQDFIFLVTTSASYMYVAGNIASPSSSTNREPSPARPDPLGIYLLVGLGTSF